MTVLPTYMLVNIMRDEGRSLPPWRASALYLSSTIRSRKPGQAIVQASQGMARNAQHAAPLATRAMIL